VSGIVSGINDLSDDEEWRRFQLGGKSALTSLSVAPSSLAGLVVPDSKTGIPLTGLGSQVYDFANMAVHALSKSDPRVGNGIAPSEDENANINEALLGKPNPPLTSLPPFQGVNLPFHQEVEDAGKRTRESARELLPPIPPTTGFERVGQDVVDSAAGMGVPLPAKLVGALPHAAQTAMSFINPTGPVIRGLGGVVGGAAGTANELQHPQQPEDNNTLQVDGVLPVPPIPPAQPTSNALPVDVSGIPTQQQEYDALIHNSQDTNVNWGEIATGIATVGAIVIGHKIATANMGAAIDAGKMARWENTTAYADHQTAIRNGTVGPGTPAPEVPLPPRPVSPFVPDFAAQTSLKARNAAVDSHAIVNDVNQVYAPTTDVADALRSQWGTSGNKQYIDERIKQVAETGHDALSGVNMPSLKDQATRIATWEEPKKTLLANAEYSADELDNRIKGWQPGQPTRPVAFSNFTDAQLRKFVADGYADPDVAFELHTNSVRNVRMVDLMENSGLIDNNVANLLRTQHPNYLPTGDVSGIIADPFKTRDLTSHSGADSAYVPPWELRKQHFESVIEARERNIPISNTIENIYDGQTRNPRAPKLIEESKDGNGNWVQPQDGSAIGYRVNGELRWAKVNNSGLRIAMQQPASSASALVRAASMVSAIARSGTTQAIAAMAGIPFSMKNALRMTTRMGIAHAPETYTGYLDRALQQATGGRVGVPGGLDPTMWSAPFVGTLQNVWGMQAHAWSELLRGGSTNPINTILRSTFGDAWTDAASARIRVAYARSIRGQMKEAGALNSTGMAAVDTPTAQVSARENLASPLNATVPELYMSYGALGSVTPKFVRLNNMFKEILNAVGESTHTFYFGLNRTNPELVRKFGYEGAQRMNAFNTRQLGGDVGQHGANELINNYAQMSKYTNVMVQDWANLTDAMAQRPFQTALNMATTVGIPVLASIYTAMLAGPAAIDHLFNEISNDQRSAQIRFYVPGQAPENSPTIPISQTDRFAIVPLLQFFADAANLQTHDPNDSYYQWFKSGLEDLFAKHITEASVQGAKKGLESATEIPTPDALNLAVSPSGQRPVINPLEMVTSGKPLFDTMHQPLPGAQPQLPGVANDRDPNAGTVTGSTFWNVISAGLGAAGSAVHQSFQAASQNYKLHHDAAEAMSALGETIAERLKGSVPPARGLLWNATEQLSTNSPIAESVRKATDALKPLIPFKSDMHNQGYTRAHGMETEPTPGEQQKLPQDPTMLSAYMVAGKLGSKLMNDKHSAVKEAADYQKLIGGLANSGKPQTEIVALHNQYVRERNMSLQRVADQIADINTAVSGVIGKQVDVRKIDWTKGVEQFH
jgi:hypothetical protein